MSADGFDWENHGRSVNYIYMYIWLCVSKSTGLVDT